MLNLEYKEKSVLIEQLAKQYRYAVLKNNLGSCLYTECEHQMIQYINYVLNELKGETKRIIINDYFDVQDEDWYLDYYQRSTYYKLKKQAMNDFLRCLAM